MKHSSFKFARMLAPWLLCLGLSLSLALPARAAGSYSDVSQTDWFYPYVSDLSSAGVINGYNDGCFRPQGSIKVGEAVKLILLAALYSEQEPTGDHWASGYLDFAVKRGFITAGEAADPEAEATRLFIAHAAAKAAGLLPARDIATPFDDTDDGYATELYKTGVVTGSVENGRTLYKPQDTITRAEMSALVWRMRNGDIHEGQIRVDWYWVDVIDGMPLNTRAAEDFSASADGRMSYSGGETRTGVDVSYYQGEVDWEAVAADGIDFAMIRLGYRGYGQAGTLALDSQFINNIEGAEKAGLEVGVYFFSQAVSAEEAGEEARFVLEALAGRSLDLPVVFDWEPVEDVGPTRTDGVTTDALCQAAGAFCKAVEAAGYKPMIYFNPIIGYINYDLGLLRSYDYWYAEYVPSPTFLYAFKMWQYTRSGSVDGIDGPVDLNLLFS